MKLVKHIILEEVPKVRYRLNVRITNIRCAGCINTIDRALMDHGAEKFDYDFPSKRAEILFEGEKSKSKDLIQAIHDAGYKTGIPVVYEA